nr:uncharacterized protein LOC116773448 [Danaus plexippus plexippus]
MTQSRQLPNHGKKNGGQLEELEPEILPCEIEKAILSQKMGKASGPDKIANELLKVDLNELLTILIGIFNKIMLTRKIPSQWKTSQIILIHKKGPKQDLASIYIKILINIYLNSEARVQLDTIEKKYQKQRGLKQGDPLSPKLFSAVLKSVFRKLNWSEFGLNIDGVKLNHLRFADDIVILEENYTPLEEMIRTLKEENAKVDLVMNRDKTKQLTNSTPTTIQADGQPLENVKDYIYLEQKISYED